MSSEYLRTDEREDLISSLKLVLTSSEQCESDLQYWKWVLIGVHSALQAAIVFHLSFGNDLLVAKPSHARKWLTAHREDGDYPDMHMDFFLALYAKAKTSELFGYKLVTSDSQDQSVKRLLELRNEFVHFMPKGWSIELALLPQVCIDSLELIETLSTNSLTMRWYEDEQMYRFDQLLGQCLEYQRRFKNEYGAA